MSTEGNAAPVPTASVRRSRRIPLVWIVPLLTALIGGWLAWDTFSKRGPTIVIAFEIGRRPHAPASPSSSTRTWRWAR